MGEKVSEGLTPEDINFKANSERSVEDSDLEEGKKSEKSENTLSTEEEQDSEKEKSTTHKNEKNTFDERLFGFSKNVEFEDVLKNEIRTELSDEVMERRKKIFKEKGIKDIDSLNTPKYLNLEKFNEDDWKNIRFSENPLLTLYSVNTLYEEKLKRRSQEYLERENDSAKVRDEALIQSLPLIHGTSLEAFEKTLEKGKLVSNKLLYKQEGKTVEEFQKSGKGATNFRDRHLGLDQYVFADFARPHTFHREQTEITLVIDPSVMNQQGVFMTEKDIADCKDVKEYLKGITTPEYFYDIANLKIRNSVIASKEVRRGRSHTSESIYNTIRQFSEGQDDCYNNMGTLNFSTWEVKLPTVSLDAVKNVIIRDEKSYNYLKEKYGDQFKFVYQPHLESYDYNGGQEGDYDILQIPGEFERQFEKIMDIDYKKRSEILNRLPKEEKEEVFVIFPKTDSKEKDFTKKITNITNPYLHPDNVIIYRSADEIIDDLQNTEKNTDIEDSKKNYLTKNNNWLWFRDPFSFQPVYESSDNCVVASFERSKKDNKIGRIVNIKEINPLQIIKEGFRER